MEAPKPYIGITGVMTADEARFLADSSSRIPAHTRGEFDLMLGGLVSSKTLRGVPNKWPGRYPRIEDLSGVFLDRPGLLNLVHYATDERETLGMQLVLISSWAGPNCHGVQLNVAWPDARQVSNYRNSVTKNCRRDVRVILQLGGRALQKIKEKKTPLSLALDPYVEREAITDILIDPSGGKGVPFEPERAKDLLAEVAEKHPQLGLGIAGGLCAETIGLLAPLVAFRERPLSIDAEGRLRNPDSDQLVTSKAARYVNAAADMLYRLPD
ncbi:MAG: hypothetical protein LC772_05940, partial [Chloroflexi bacterium]|nr:hypothetical protein [Chloroflexota bacterium]